MQEETSSISPGASSASASATTKSSSSPPSSICDSKSKVKVDDVIINKNNNNNINTTIYSSSVKQQNSSLAIDERQELEGHELEHLSPSTSISASNVSVSDNQPKPQPSQVDQSSVDNKNGAHHERHLPVERQQQSQQLDTQSSDPSEQVQTKEEKEKKEQKNEQQQQQQQQNTQQSLANEREHEQKYDLGNHKETEKQQDEYSFTVATDLSATNNSNNKDDDCLCSIVKNNNSNNNTQQQESQFCKTKANHKSPAIGTITSTSTYNKAKQRDHEANNDYITNNDHNHHHHHRNNRRNLAHLTYTQRLLLHRWPLIALLICIMSSLVMAIVLAIIANSLFVCQCANFHQTSASSSPQLSNNNKIISDNLLSRSSLAIDGDLSGGNEPSQIASTSSTQSFRRLPTSIWPIHYDLFFQPHLKASFEFDGEAAIRFLCTKETNNITLHARDLHIDDKWLRLDRIGLNSSSNNTDNNDGADNLPNIVGWQSDKELQHMTINLSSNLVPNTEYKLFIKFKGLLNDELAGFYRIKYDDGNGKTIWIAATQFQATDARRAFPCFDEPSYKATFTIKIKHYSNMTALSNMPIVYSQNLDDGWTIDIFDKTRRMSTYLVAFAVTNFESRTLGNITVWARPNLVRTADYALSIAGKILKRYEEFFGVSYPLPKMDMIALPDFNAGAMENWGLITYRETAMLYDNQTSSISNKQRVATVVAHELAHQWFGNLVTPKWWDDLWLNEGFASYVEYIGVDHVEPGWKMLDQFVIEEVQDVFKADSLSTSHQISIPVNNPDEINEIFDRISYGKGASIIRMMNHFLTEKVFQAGLRRYLASLQYGNAEQADLWMHLTQVQPKESAVDVGKVMNSWTLQTGYPVVTVTRDYERNKVHLDQMRFKLSIGPSASSSNSSTNSTTNKDQSEKNPKWEIPITFTTSKELNWEPTTRLWMHQNDSGPVELDKKLVPAQDEWILLNVRQVGYYRVNYDRQNWRLLIDQLEKDHTKITPINRAQILDDIFDLARTGMIDYKFAMNATKYLTRETDFLAWDTVLRSFVFIDDMLERSPVYGEWKEYIADLIEPYYGNYKNESWTFASLASERSNNDVLAQYNRVNAVFWACQVNKHCVNKARKLFDHWRQTGQNQIDPSLRNILYCNAIENGDKYDWEFLWLVYEKEQNANERDRILRALACSKELWILSRYLEWIFDKTKPIRRQDGTFVFRAVANNNYGRDVAFNFLRDRWSTIKEYYGKTSFSFSNLIKSVTISHNTNFELQQLKQFFQTVQNDVGTAKRSFLQSIEEVESNVDWMAKNYKTIESWIRETRGKPYL